MNQVSTLKQKFRDLYISHVEWVLCKPSARATNLCRASSHPRWNLWTAGSQHVGLNENLNNSSKNNSSNTNSGNNNSSNSSKNTCNKNSNKVVEVITIIIIIVIRIIVIIIIVVLKIGEWVLSKAYIPQTTVDGGNLAPLRAPEVL